MLVAILDMSNLNDPLIYTSSELKRRLKAEQKAKEKAEKEAERPKPATAEKKADKINEEDISPNEYFKLRTAAVAELKKNPETHPYPHKFKVTTSLEEFVTKYNSLTDGEVLDDVKIRLVV